MKRIGLVAVLLGIICLLSGLAILSGGKLDNLLLFASSSLLNKPISPHWIGKLRVLAYFMSLGGIILVVMGLLAVRGKSIATSFTRSDARLFAVFAAAILFLWMPPVLIGHSASFSGERYWWLHDDAMISMRYACNAAHGLGLVWNPGERVEGYTNFLWMSFMAFVHFVQVPESKTSLIVLLANIALAIAVIYLMIKLVRVLGGGMLATWATLTTFSLNRDAMLWTIDGLETMLLTLFFALGIYLVIRDALRDRVGFSPYAVLAVMALVRADAIVLTVLSMGMSLIINKRKKRVIAYSVLALALPIAHEVFRLLYYGDLLPNTAYLKVMNWRNRSSAGIEYIMDFIKAYPIILLLAAMGAVFARNPITLSILGLVAVYSVYVASIGGDAFGNRRFFVPVVPMLMIVAYITVESFRGQLKAGVLPHAFYRIRRTGIALWILAACGALIASICMPFCVAEAERYGKPYDASMVAGLVLFFMLCFVLFVCLKKKVEWIVILICLMASPLIMPGYMRYMVPSKSGIGNVEIGLLLKEKTSPDCIVADFWAGSVFYFSRRHGIDMLGKCDRYIARLRDDSKESIPGHNKFDFRYSLGELKPDYVIANFRLPVEAEAMKRVAVGKGAFTGQLYFDRIFREHYLLYPMPVNCWRSIFARDGNSGFPAKGNGATFFIMPHNRFHGDSPRSHPTAGNPEC